jgi:hypothetical protein
MNLYSYARKRLFAQDNGRQDFIHVLSKRMLKSVARSTGARIHKNKWVRLLDELVASYPETHGVTLLTDMKSSIDSYVRTHPKTVVRINFLIDYVKRYRSLQLNVNGTLFSEYQDQFTEQDDLDWMKEVARKHRLDLADCGHWSANNDTFHLIGTAESYEERSTCCASCASTHISSGAYINSRHSSNQLVEATHAVDYRSYGSQILTGDSRNPALSYDAQRRVWHDNQWSPYSGLIDSYHSSKNKGFNIIDSPWFRSHRRAFGCELEVQVTRGDKDKLCGKVHDILNPSGSVGEYCYFERDGSIGEGFEIVTQPAGLDIHRAKFDAFLNNDEAKQGLRSHEGGSCGLHVHVGKQYVTQSQIYRIQSFLNDVRNESLIRAIARRYASGYSKFKPEMAKFTAHNKNTGDRYEALNVTGRETIEFRIFRGSLRYESVIAALEFVNAVLTFCTPGVTSIMDFHAIGFKKFIMSDEMKPDTKFLRSYLSLDVNTDNERRTA